MSRFLLATSQVLFVSWCLLLAVDGVLLAQQPIRVACLGDSITAGARVNAETESYPARLQFLMGHGYHVKNFGIGGATLIKPGSPNVWKCLKEVEEFQPDVVVISLGTNDTVSGNRKNWERIERFESDYQLLIDSLTEFKSQPRIVLCTPTAMVLETEGLSPNRLSNLKQRKPRLAELCEKIRLLERQNSARGVSLLDLNSTLAGHPGLMTKGDGVHPNKAGYEAVAQTVAKHVNQLFERSKQPNIVLFLVDDMGWQDTSVPFHANVTTLNQKFRTPNMKKLAARGMKFTQAYACSVCSPTRISLMTGMSAARHRVTNWTLRKNASNDRKHPRLDFPKWNVNGLSPVAGVERTVTATTLPALLQKSGYRTIHVGKAHFGALGTPGSDPLNLGFDVNIGGHAAGGPGSFLGTQNFSAAWRNADRVWDVPGLEKYHGKDIFLTEALTIEANRAVDEAVDDGKPFFLYMSHYAVHVPFARDKRYHQKYIDAGLGDPESMYAAMVEGMDQSLGDILANLEKHGLSDETIVMFMSDNGGLSAHGRGGKPNTHNRPLSSGKGSAHEGGVRVPMIVAHPGTTTPGSVCHQPVIIEDFYPTILELANVGNANTGEQVVDGRSFASLLSGKVDLERKTRPLFWHYPNHWGPNGPGIGPSSTIRKGNWKLIYYHDGQHYELFDLDHDISEQNNLAETKAEIRIQLASKLAEYLESVDAQMPVIRSSQAPVPYPGRE